MSGIHEDGGEKETLKGRRFRGRNDTRATRPELRSGGHGNATEGGEQ